MDTNKFVIKIENGQPVNHPLTYSNFLALFPECQAQENPTNEVISPYGYEVFENTEYPIYELGPYIQKENGTWTNTWVQAS